MNLVNDGRAWFAGPILLFQGNIDRADFGAPICRSLCSQQARRRVTQLLQTACSLLTTGFFGWKSPVNKRLIRNAHAAKFFGQLGLHFFILIFFTKLIQLVNYPHCLLHFFLKTRTDVSEIDKILIILFR